jgi:diaminopimelate decarboxylase
MNQLATVNSFDVSEVARTFGTPTWVYDQAIIEQRISEVKAFDVIRYAQKANSNLAILKIMKKEGVVVDAVSAGEVIRAIKAGYTTDGDHPGVVFTADMFDEDALKVIRKYKVPVNVGSPDMIVQLAEAGIHVDVTLRINPGFGHGHSAKVNTGGDVSKHGIWHEQIETCIELGEKHGVNIHGLHMHIGSGSDLKHLSEVAGSMVDAAKRFGKNLKVISAGGGLPIPYNKEDTTRIDVDAYFKVWDDARQEIAAILGHDISLEVEPGRYLIAESGYLVTRIASIKQQDQKNFYLIDAGFNDLVRPSFYGAYHHITIVSADDRTLEGTQDVVVAGPLCESCDVFTQEDGGFVTTRALPHARVGDYLVLHDAGAYGMAMSSNYNTRRIATEVLIHEGKLLTIRERQTFESIMQFEKVPDHLGSLEEVSL